MSKPITLYHLGDIPEKIIVKPSRARLKSLQGGIVMEELPEVEFVPTYIGSEIVKKFIDYTAHENLTKKLNRANERIVEFEDIKKAHLKYVKKLKDRIQELEERND